MPETFEWPSHSSPTRRPNRKLPILLALVAAVFLFGRGALSWWVEWLWFGSLGFSQVFTRTLTLRWGTFALFAAITFLYLYGLLSLLRRTHNDDLPSDHTILVNGQEVTLPIKRFFNLIALAVAAVVAALSGGAMASSWAQLALFWQAPAQGAGPLDPIFARPLSFYLFVLPAWNLISGWLMALAVVSCISAAVLLLVSGGARAIEERRLRPGSLPWRGLSGTFAFLLLVAAARVWLSRFDQLTERHTIFSGVGYTGAHVTLTGTLLLSLALVLGALVAASNLVLAPRGRRLIAALLPAVVCFVGMGAISWYVNQFEVKPNELVREQPYISHNIAATRAAYGLDRFEQKEYPAETTVEATDPAHNQATFQNIRLWDWRALQDTLRQIQEIRTYYDFPDIDIDRYTIDGVPRQVMLAARELNIEKLPGSSRNWINEKLIYTHGYGLTVNPVNGFTPEGLPTLWMSNMPVQSTVASLKVNRPEIYFGELTDSDVYVKTRQKEFNYPQGESNNLTTYEGSGGIELGGFLRRALIAFDRGDLAKVPFSDDIGPQSRLLMRRNVVQRVQTLAPWLTFEQDPYLVIGNDGRLSFILDGFTTSADYPFATHYRFGSDTVNYVRNSVKAVVNAYDGTTTFYVFDKSDPIIAAYVRLFPELFKDASAMPADLRSHTRFPEALLRLQAEVYGLYHMTNPEVFYNREDQWTVATEMAADANGAQTQQAIQPNFVMMTLPGEHSVEFVEILPFTPVNRNNLIGWIAARSDGEHYGSSVVYNFPKSRMVDGPLQIEARIDQNAQLSGQLTLWNQQGSRVRRGSLLVIPSGRGLLYAESIYLQAQHSPMPELRLVVLALQDQLAYGPTFEAALNSLYGSGAPTISSAAPSAPGQTAPAAGSTAPAKPANELSGLIGQAGRAFDDYQKLTAQGKLAEAGQKLEELKRTLEQLNARSK